VVPNDKIAAKVGGLRARFQQRCILCDIDSEKHVIISTADERSDGIDAVNPWKVCHVTRFFLSARIPIGALVVVNARRIGPFFIHKPYVAHALIPSNGIGTHAI
jgi:hypothetical protein